MIKNSVYTYNYFQPDEYRFSLDSVFLAQKVASLIGNEPGSTRSYKSLDLCAGCGIIGLELSLHCPELKSIDFLEIQEIYQPYFEKNLKLIHPHSEENKFQFLLMNYSDLISEKFANTYDLIVCNPPYFLKGEGLLSPSEFKNRCRFFIDSDFKTLFESIHHALKLNSRAFVLVRSGEHHGRNPLKTIESLLLDRAQVQIVDNIRGTDVIEITKKAL